MYEFKIEVTNGKLDATYNPFNVKYLVIIYNYDKSKEVNEFNNFKYVLKFIDKQYKLRSRTGVLVYMHLPEVINNYLVKKDIINVSGIVKITKAQWLSLPGIGEETIKKLTKELAKHRRYLKC